jgi:hypothetical protein
MTVTINGKDHELHFGMKAFLITQETIGAPEADENLDTDAMAAILWGGLKNAAFRDKKSLSVSFADVCDYVDESFWNSDRKKVLDEIVAAFSNSHPVQKMKESEAVQEDVKKKETEAMPTS